MKKFGHLLTVLILLPCFLTAQIDLELVEIASGFSGPLDIQHAGDERLFIVEQSGAIKIIDANGDVLDTPFIDIDDRVNDNANERGLLGLAFHPDYQNNGFFYVNYSNSSGDTHISRFTVTADPNVADPDSEVILMEVDQPFNNHNGGGLDFGPDGYLYIGLGDGGSGGDPLGNSQNTQTLLGKMLRIDVDNGDPYAIPADNPFVNDSDVLDEIWSIGLRNPWRFSFDRETGEMWIGDVGQNEFEEIDFEPANTGGLNYGWRCYEGFATFNTSGCGNASEYTDPAWDYANTNSVGRSVTGGYVYRGSEYSDLIGHYIYADFVSGRIWSLTPDGNGGWTNVEFLNWTNNQIGSFGEDLNGEMYLAALIQGRIYKLTTTCTSFQVNTAITDASCFGEADGNVSVTPPDPNSTIVWNSGATTFDLTDLSEGHYLATITDGNGCTTEIIETVSQPDELELNPIAQDISCFGETDGTITLELPSANSTVIWNTGAMTPTLDNLPAGTYMAIVTDDNGCTGNVSALITEPAEINFELNIDGNGNVAAPDGFANYEWYDDGGNLLPNETNSTVMVQNDDSGFFVIVTDDNGCIFTSPTLFILDVNQIEGLTEFKISPNPFTNQLSLNLVSEQVLELNLQLLNLDGKILQEEKIQTTTNFSKTMNLEDLPKGVYYLKLSQGSNVAVQRVVKQ